MRLQVCKFQHLCHLCLPMKMPSAVAASRDAVHNLFPQDHRTPGLQAPGLKGACHFCSSARRISHAVGEGMEAGGRPE